MSSVSSMFLAQTTGNAAGSETIIGQISNGGGEVISAANWKPSTEIPVSDDLLSTNNGSGGNGPVSISPLTPVSGLGAYIQADGPGQFTAQIQAYTNINGVLTLVLSKTATSLTGDPVFLGVSDAVAEITKVVYSLTSAPKGYSTGDFVLDSLLVQDPFNPVPVTVTVAPQDNQAPEPGMAGLLGLALPLLAWGFKLKRRSATI